MSVSLIPEYGEPCKGCGNPQAYRFYIEVGELRGNTDFWCPSCWRAAVPHPAELEVPPQDRGAHPPSRRMRKTSQKQELEMAQLIGGRRQKGSGALLGNKGDVRLPGVLRGEMKLTSKRSFTLTREMLDKIRSECVGRERPFVGLRFIDPNTQAAEDEWVIIPLEDWEHATSHDS